MYFKALGDAYGFDLDTPVRDIPPQVWTQLLYGTGNKKLKIERVFAGIRPSMKRPSRALSTTWSAATKRRRATLRAPILKTS